MKYYVGIFLVFAALCGCSSPDGNKYSVLFQPFSADLDPQAKGTVQAAATFAKAHPLMPLSIAGDASRPDEGDYPTLRQERVAVVQNALVSEGVDRLRIEVLGNGLLYPNGVPDQPRRRVIINIGL